jgi:putative FmdB family regulatory protein
MPFYEYECPNCGYRDEVLQKINDKPLKKCPNCGKNGLKKLMSAPVFRLKGSGWYETDFKTDKDNKRNLAGADKDEAKSESKSESKSDTKPDAKAETKSDSKADVAKPAPVKTATGKSKPKAKASRPAKRPGSRR